MRTDIVTTDIHETSPNTEEAYINMLRQMSTAQRISLLRTATSAYVRL